MSTSPAIVWFRRDLRLADNPALHNATRRGGIVPVFLWSPDEEKPWQPGAASRWWLHHALTALAESLAKQDVPLRIRSGSVREELIKLAGETGATAVYWNRLYDPVLIARDTELKKALQDAGLEVRSFNGALINEPHAVLTQQDKPYQVFTPYYRACLAQGEPAEPLQIPKLTGPTAKDDAHRAVAALALLPQIAWDTGFRSHWQPGEAGARKLLDRFARDAAARYDTDRDLPAVPGTSRLSPHLHTGEISPRQIWHTIRKHCRGKDGEPYLRQIVWREFAHQLLYHFPHTPEHPLRAEFRDFPWGRDDAALRAWQRGLTGFPIVDAGMRELWHTGWMHNRVRMIVGSMLVKDFLIPWQEGAKWFWDTLVDADLPNNTLGWQWIGGCGADAAPYFRIFNPFLQAARFDPQGDYVRRWVPELAKLDAKWIHHPHEAPRDELVRAGVQPGRNYPLPIVDHSEARDRALAAYREMRARKIG